MEPLETTAVQEQPVGRKSHKSLLATLLIFTLLFAFGLGICAYAAQMDTIFPNYQIWGIDVGGLTAEEATEKLESEFPEKVFTLEYGSGFLDLPYAAFGASLDYEAAVKTATRSESRSFFGDGKELLFSFLGISDLQVSPRLNLDEAVFEERWVMLQNQLSTPATGAYFLVTEDSVEVTMAVPGRTPSEVSKEQLQQDVCLSDHGHVLMIPAPTDNPTASALAEVLSGEARNASYDSATNTFLPEVYHAEFNIASAQVLLDQTGPGETAVIPARTELPTVFLNDLKATLYRDLLGECTTKVGGSAGRKHNVQLAAQAFDGYILNPGEQFSFNKIVGKRTPDKGYKEAPAYLNGETVMEFGGGVCQTASTLYLASLRSDLQIDERHAHRYMPTYVPGGMDATVSWGGPDYQFTNNTDYPIRIDTGYQNNHVTVQLWGTNVDGTTVKMTNEQLSSTPYEEVTKEDPSLAPGETEVSVTPYTGYHFKTYRNRYDRDGNRISSVFEADSDYKARDQVTLIGPVAQPEPALPTPEEPSETPETEAPEEVLPETPETPETPENTEKPEKPADPPIISVVVPS